MQLIVRSLLFIMLLLTPLAAHADDDDRGAKLQLIFTADRTVSSRAPSPNAFIKIKNIGNATVDIERDSLHWPHQVRGSCGGSGRDSTPIKYGVTIMKADSFAGNTSEPDQPVLLAPGATFSLPNASLMPHRRVEAGDSCEISVQMQIRTVDGRVIELRSEKATFVVGP